MKIYLPVPLKVRIDELALRSGKPRSAFIKDLLETVLFSDKGYAAYMAAQNKLSAKYWELEYEKAEARSAIQKDEVPLTAWNEK